MPKRPSSDEVAKVLRRHGFVLIGQKGSQVPPSRQPDPDRHRPDAPQDLRVGTFHSILEQSGLSEDDF